MWSCCGVLTRLWSLCGQMLRSWYRSFADPPASTIHALNFVDKYWPVGTVVLPDPPASTIQSVTCIEVQITFWTNIGRLVPWFCRSTSLHDTCIEVHSTLKTVHQEHCRVHWDFCARSREEAHKWYEWAYTYFGRIRQEHPKYKAVGKHAPKKEKHSFFLKVNWY